MTAWLRRRTTILGAGALAVAPVLGGCLPSPPPAPRRFYLSSLEPPPADLPTARWSLVVEPPQTLPALRTARIAQAIGANEFDYYADAEWGDLPPFMFQGVLIRAFERSGAVPVVVSERQRIRTDFMLNTYLAPFFAVGAVGMPPTARVGIDAQLIRYRGRAVVGTRSFEEARPAATADIEDVVAAFDAAAHAVMRDLLRWTVTAGNAAGGTT